MTAFADYRVPQTLLDAKVLEYSEELIKILKDKTPIDQDDPNEVEIRCVSLHAIELLVIEVNKISDIKVTSVILDRHGFDCLVITDIWQNCESTSCMPLYSLYNIGVLVLVTIT